ncbi:MAG TPA: sigma 54-interacting transcriptional regulator [Ktedonobacterales bacterium]
MQEQPQELVAISPSMADLVRAIARTAHTPATTLITGEPGTGKSLVAAVIHAASGRTGPFLIVDGSQSGRMLDVELFGRESFAADPELGLFERASGGTLFIDHVEALPRTTQARLLSALQERVIEHVGGTTPIAVDARVIAATSANLAEAVREGRFRENLFYRLCVISLTVPPLRERREDIPALVTRFLATAHGIPEAQVEPLTPEILSPLVNHRWPGNVRELEARVRLLVAVRRGGPILPRHVARVLLETLPDD